MHDSSNIPHLINCQCIVPLPERTPKDHKRPIRRLTKKQIKELQEHQKDTTDVQMMNRFPLAAGLPEPPRKPKPVYNLFCQVERAKILGQPPGILEERKRKNTDQKRKHRRTHGKISFSDLSKRVSSNWRALCESEKQVYKAIYKKNMDAYKQELEEYNDCLKELGEHQQQEISERKAFEEDFASSKTAPGDEREIGSSSPSVHHRILEGEPSRKISCANKQSNPPVKGIEEMTNTQRSKGACSLETDFQVVQPIPMGEMLSRNMSDVESDLMAYIEFLRSASFGGIR